MAKFNQSDYSFIDLTETDLSTYPAEQIEASLADTYGILEMTAKKKKKTPMNLALVAGLLEARGGRFIKVCPLYAKWKKGQATKKEIKIIKKAISSAKVFYLFKNIWRNVIKNENVGFEELVPMLAVKNK